MSLHESLQVTPKVSLYALIISSLIVIILTIISLSLGITIVFQNLYYFPIIIACAFYLRKGFIFSLILIGIYGLFILIFAHTQNELISALIRILIFIVVAGVVTWLSSRYEERTKELIESEKKFKQLFNANDSGIALHEIICDERGNPVDYRFLNVNPSYEKMTGLLGSDIVGKTVREILPGTEDYWVEAYGAVAKTGITKKFEQYSKELGKYFEVTAYSPEPGTFACLIHDVTDRKNQEKLVNETNAYLENLITHANVPIIIWDPDYHITRVNRAFELLCGRPAEYLEGGHLSILFHPAHADRSMRLIKTTHEGVRWDTVEIPIIHQDGTARTVLWNSATIYGPDGKKPVATIAQGCDVTLERFLELEKERAAIQIQENIAQLAILNDGIRNPLTIIASYADLAGDEQIAARIQHEVMRIDEMVNNLDREWVHSEKILNYLRKNDKVAIDFVPTHAHTNKGQSHFLQTEQVLSSPYLSSHERYVEEIQTRLYSILDSTDAYIYVVDLETYDILYLNEQGRKLFGNVIGQKCYGSIYGIRDGPCSFCTNNLIREKAGSKEVIKGEFLLPKTDRWYESRTRAIPWADGRLVRLEIGTDVTDRKLAEKRDKLQLVRLEAFLTLLNMADSSEMDILSFSLEKSLTVSESIYAFVGLMSSDESEMEIHTWSQGALEICSILEKPIHFPIKDAGIWGECVRTRSPFIHNDYSAPHPAKHGSPEGHIPITRFLGVPICDGNQIVAVLAVANKLNDYSYDDVNTLLTLGNIMWEMVHRGRISDELIQKNRYNRTLIETSLDPLVTIGKDGKITDVNSATEQITGYSRDDLIGTDFSDYFTDPELARTGYLTVFEKGLVRDYPLAIRHKDGTITDVLYNASVYLNEHGEMEGVFAAARDVTECKKIEIALFEQEERFRLALRATNDVIWDYDIINDTQRWNESGTVVFGWTDIVHHQQSAAWWTDRVHTDDCKRVAREFENALRDPLCLKWHDEYRFRRSDGQYAYVMDRGYIIRDSSGQAIRMIGAMLDISNRKKAEEALAESEKRFRDLVDTITSGVGVYSVQGDGRYGKDYIITDFNRMALEIEGKMIEEVIGKSLADLRPNIDEYGLIPVFQRVWKTGIPEYFPQKLYLDQQYANYYENRVFKLKSGEIVAVYNDVTDQKRLEVALQESRALLDSTQHLAKVGGWEYDVRTHAMTWTDETYRIHEIEPGTIPVGSPDHILESLRCYDKIDQPVIQQAFNLCVSEGIPYVLEFPLTTQKNNRIWIQTMGRAVLEDGQVVKVIGNIVDITERKRIEDALRQANRQLNLLTAVTRHDIINKTSVIYDSLGIAEIDHTDPSLDQLFRIIKSATDAIKSHIEFTRTYQKLGSHEPQWYLLDDVMPSTVPSTIQFRKETGNYEVFADPMFSQVFTNLLDNSVRHGKHVTEIRVHTVNQKDELVIMWEDNGIGVSFDYKERVFDRGIGDNTGYGLFLVREVLQITGITISECGVEGKGARFEIIVPKWKFRRKDT